MGNLRIVHFWQDQLKLKVVSGMSSMMSKAVEIWEVVSYFKTMGWIDLPAENAPFLNLFKPVPLVVKPSANMSRGLYNPVSSTSYCLSSIICIIFYFSSSVPPLGMKMESRTAPRLPISGAFRNISSSV